MSAINTFVEFIRMWFGFVGSCIGSPSGACVPFLAFFALGVAAAAALVLLLLAYQSFRQREILETGSEAAGIRAIARSERMHSNAERPAPA